MSTLSREHRRLLEKTVAEARRIAEDGARTVLQDQYAVHHHEPWPHMSAVERDLRNQLRAHGRQLGDARDARRETQEIDHLVQATAYEHWHRMLFARFLAENDLLLDADLGVAMTLDEVRELAREQGRDWMDLAAGLAQRMLLEVFRPDDPVLQVQLPPETRQQLEEKLEALPREIFLADDSLGWVYQFWQRDEKDRVNKAEVKIGADELPAVTQLFTEDYMVLFLLENTLGAWWTAKRRAEGKDPALPGYTWTYLRLNEDGSPAAGAFDGWPRAARDLRVLDPCMGSGHFLVFALPILARMRMEEEGLSLKGALAAVLKENLFGLEIDARCSQIAAFNLALAAWRIAGEHFPLPQLNLACSGLGIHASESDWVELAGEDGLAREEMRRLYSLFKDAPTLGSLIDPLRLKATVYSAGADRVLPLIEEALEREQSEETRELAIAAQGVLAAFRILASRFTLVATNVPYLGRGKQDPVLADYCAEFHADAKADLATCFVDRCLRFARDGGSVALVTPQNWLFLTSYKKLRERLLKSEQWDFVARLGEHAFDSPAAAGAFAALLGLTRRAPAPEHAFAGWKLESYETPAGKSDALRSSSPQCTYQRAQLGNPDSVVALEEIDSTKLLGHYAACYQGVSPGDSERLVACFWEVDNFERWRAFQGPPVDSGLYRGREFVIDWPVLEKGFEAAAIRGYEAWGKPGVAIGQLRELPATLYSGDLFSNSTPVIIPTDSNVLRELWSFCSSKVFQQELRKQNPKLSVDNGYVSKIPFDLTHWHQVAAQKYPNGLPKPHSDDPTQWLFSGHPKCSDHPLQVAVARLVGYRWPRQTGSSFPDCPALGPDGLEKHADADGIVPLASIAGEASAADRLRALLADAYGEEWSAAKLRELLGEWESLEDWLCDGFFEEHCRIFHQRPFVWHIWDGRKDGFHALVNYHRLAGPNGEARKTLEKLIYTYLGRWIERQQDEVKAGKEGADARLTAALHLKAELEKTLEGEKPYDLFVRWKPLHEQPIGWEPDINDGVRLNIRPWLQTTLAPVTKPRKGACVLRVTPKINYGKDRGKEPHRAKEDYPWFWSWDERTDDFPGGAAFDGARWNDLHYSLKKKKEARERKQAEVKA
ncbi:MAG: BREX-1 system adenine-specific DNA-methyltransferase PglX [Bryobacterales bacterium]|nr:BREX-1 system adenine-specific DNA-methyltransferase PglX [Bryobacterales bacterium]